MYVCPSCGAGLKFDPTSQKLKCDYCGSEFDTSEVEDTDLKSAKGEKVKEYDEKSNDIYEAYAYRCTQCGAELITTDETIATFCSYCGSSAVLERRDITKKKPNYVIPFVKTKEECKEIYKNKLKKAFFAPKNMLDTQQVDKIRGIYMPYWIYSYEKHGEHTAKGSVYSRRSGDYVYYKDYKITTNIDAECSGIPHDASAYFSDRLSEAIAPYSMKDKKEFAATFLSGFYADSEDVDGNTYIGFGKQVANNQASKELKKDHTYGKYGSSPTVDMNLKNTELGLFPVYFLSTRNDKGDRISYAVINGQTGKIAADIPIDFKKFLMSSAIISVIFFILLNAMFTFTPTVIMILAMIFNIISLFVVYGQLDKINKRDNNLDDAGFMAKENIDKKKKTLKSQGKMKQLGKPLIGFLLGLGILVLNPISDVFYYSCAIVSIVMVIWSISDIIKEINILATRKLPQLEKRGGDENA